MLKLLTHSFLCYFIQNGQAEEDEAGEEATEESSTTSKLMKKQQKLNLFSNLDDEQKELLKEAFATQDDEIEEEFRKEKQELAEEDAGLTAQLEESRAPAMPGWGSWAGEGVQSKPKTKKQLEAGKSFVSITSPRSLSHST